MLAGGDIFRENSRFVFKTHDLNFTDPLSVELQPLAARGKLPRLHQGLQVRHPPRAVEPERLPEVSGKLGIVVSS